VFFVEEFSAQIDTVWVPELRNHITVRVWSWIGCGLNCQFSYTRKMGLKGNLSTAHVVEQLVIGARMCNQELVLGVVTNVMFMAMGEPFQNIDNKITDVEIMTNGQGLHLSPLKVAIQPQELCPRLEHFAKLQIVALAVSSNVTTHKVRDQIMCEQEVQVDGFIRLCGGGACDIQARRKGMLPGYALENVTDSTDNVG
jgi:23S rRNA (adenine2503-C2)-methyltransferase